MRFNNNSGLAYFYWAILYNLSDKINVVQV